MNQRFGALLVTLIVLAAVAVSILAQAYAPLVGTSLFLLF